MSGRRRKEDREMTTYAGIKNALEQGAALDAFITGRGFALTTPVLEAARRGKTVYVRTHEAGWISMPQWGGYTVTVEAQAR